MSSQYKFRIGEFVRPVAGRIGNGKILRIDAGEYAVEFFRAVSRTDVRVFRAEELVAVRLARQTRCYVHDSETGRWTMGRIGVRDELTYEVNFPDKRSRWVVESDIRVRCNAPCEDPTETLVLKSHETAAFHAQRFALVKALVRQRALSRGVTGLTSSRIELFAHQVEVVRRVLEDPVQRYLLADEVGLGKTIEAGVLIRQYLLDEEEGLVVIVVPPLLHNQWRREMHSRFDVMDSGRVLVVPTTELERVPTNKRIGMLVVDEAHHVTAGATAHDTSARAMFERCRSLAHATERVILLSATPAASNEAQFLAMLHLLDPQTYRLDDVESFRERVRKRQDVGRLLLAVTEEARPYSLRLSLPKIAALFPGDERLATLARAVLEALERAPSDLAARAEPIRAIRTHVSETYRLHRRMLRNRRSAIADSILDRGDQPLIAVRDESDEVSRVDGALEEWRTLIATFVRGAEDSGGDGSMGEAFLAVFLELAQMSDGSPHLLDQAVRWRLHGDEDARQALALDVPAKTVRWLRELPLVLGEAETLAELVTSARAVGAANARMQKLERLLRDLRARAVRVRPPKCVIFTGYSSTARRIAERLDAVLGKGRVARHIAGLTSAAIEDGVYRFRESHDCFVLVCDRTAEEGRNLQFADLLIHHDLPWSPNRLEQRIGRVDRIGRVRDLTSYVLLGRDTHDSLHEMWFRVLGEGFGLFETSIASLQFFVDEQMPKVVGLAFRYGAAALIEFIADARRELDTERERIEEQAAIDEIDVRDENAASYARALDRADAAHETLRDAVDGWMCETLQFAKEPFSRIRGAISYVALDRTLVPADVLAARFLPFLGRAGTYDRTVAARIPEVALFRPGESMLDSLAEFVAGDDRGKAFAVWREVPDWHAGEGIEWLGFRFDVLVDADTRVARELVRREVKGHAALASLDRRAGALFPPRLETIYVSVALAEVRDETLLEQLGRPFRKIRGPHGIDHNLTKHRLGAINDVVAEDSWERLCSDARDTALQLIRERPKFQERCEKLATTAEAKLGVKLEQLRLRAKRDLGTDPKEIKMERAVGGAIVAGIRSPRLQIDAAGFIVISGRGPLRPDSSLAGAPQRA